MRPTQILLSISTLLTGCYRADPVCIGATAGTCSENGEGDRRGGDCALPPVEGAVEGDDPRAETLRGESSPIFYGAPTAQIGNDVAFVGDMDGDGFGDLAIPDREYRRADDDHQRGVVYLVYGREAFCELEAFEDEVLLEGDDTFGDFELAVEPAGDVDADGYADLLVGDRNGIACYHMDEDPGMDQESAYGRIYVVYGGPRRAGAEELAAAGSMIRHSIPCSSAGQTVAGLGDLDGDGYGDLAFSANTGWSDGDDVGIGRVYITYGGPARLGAESTEDVADAVLRSDGSMDFGLSIAAPGDVDGDGRGDFLIVEKSRAWFVRGTEERLHGDIAIADVALPIDGLQDYAQAAGLGDLDADGFGDFALAVLGPIHIDQNDSDIREATLHVFYGGEARLDGPATVDLADAVLRRPRSAWSNFTVGGVNDFDGDGDAEIIVGDASLADGGGGAYLVRGDVNRLLGDYSIEELATRWHGGTRVLVTDEDEEGHEWVRREEFQDRAGGSIVGGGDIDGDGLADLFVGASTDHVHGELGGRVFVIRGR